MSAAIKRLSTIIRPSSNSSPPSPPEKKDSIDAPAPAAPVETSASDAAPATETTPNGTTTHAVNAVKSSAAAETGANADPAPAEDTKAAPPSTDADALKDKEETTTPAPVESKKEKEGKATHRRDPRDIGRSTIRRFSTILRSQLKDTHKDKEPTPPLPTQEKPAEAEAKAPEEQEPAPTAEAPKDATAKADDKENAAPAEKDAKLAKPAPSATKDKSKGGKVVKRRSASFFTAAREGLQRTAKDVQTRARGRPSGAKTKASAEVETVPKIVKKGAAKGKRVVVITGASSGVGLEFVKHFAAQPNTFVIALSRSAEKSAALKPIVSASAKDGHNVRAIKLDVASTRSIQGVAKDIVELTEGRIDVLINAAGSRGDPALKVWEIKGNELETELRNNLVGPIAFTNALIPYLKPMPPKEEKKEEKAEAKDAVEGKTEDKAEEKKEEAKDAVEGKTEDKAEEKKEEAKTEEQAEEKKEEAKIDDKAEKGEEKPADEAQVEIPEATEAKVDAQEPAVAATSAEPSTEAPANTTAEAKGEKLAEASPAEGESTEPATSAETPVEAPSTLPAQPFVIFLAPADAIQNVDGTVPTGSSFAPSPRTLYSLSRAALQVAIAKYAAGLGGQGVGVVGVERPGLHDPHSDVSDEQAAAGVVKLLPELSIRDNGKLLRASTA